MQGSGFKVQGSKFTVGILPGDYGTCSYPTRTYVKARRVLDQYQHMPSFHSIQQDCAAIVGELKTVLKARLDDQKVCMFIPCCWSVGR